MKLRLPCVSLVLLLVELNECTHIVTKDSKLKNFPNALTLKSDQKGHDLGRQFQNMNSMQNMLLRLIIMGIAAFTSTLAFDPSSLMSSGRDDRVLQGNTGGPDIHIFMNTKSKKIQKSTVGTRSRDGISFRNRRRKRLKKLRPINYNDDFALQTGMHPGGTGGRPNPPSPVRTILSKVALE